MLNPLTSVKKEYISAFQANNEDDFIATFEATYPSLQTPQGEKAIH